IELRAHVTLSSSKSQIFRSFHTFVRSQRTTSSQMFQCPTDLSGLFPLFYKMVPRTGIEPVR
ncbi:hypothetical protein ABET41_21385, partial [Metabacillus fastidiosus]|uniref:hypothetical protein n=1 Tax=Metabacillus fastidiosus TaxID=1458 RepID=UPI003D29840F